MHGQQNVKMRCVHSRTVVYKTKLRDPSVVDGRAFVLKRLKWCKLTKSGVGMLDRFQKTKCFVRKRKRKSHAWKPTFWD